MVCGGTDWLELPQPHPSRSVRSDGAILDYPLEKAQCSSCALVQTILRPGLEALQSLYRDDYDIYNNRPASEQFVTGRYTALAQAITASVSPYYPKKVLEVGCGNGAALQAVQAIWTQAKCIGMEPVTSAVAAAQAMNLDVSQGMIGTTLPSHIANERFDVIYTIHVIEHTDNPIDYLKTLSQLLEPHGRLVVTCPNASVPNLEIMRPDHHYSMMPYHLTVLARKAGLSPLKSTLCPGGGEGLDYEHNQLLLCQLASERDLHDSSVPVPDYLSQDNQMKIFGSRSKYFHDFAMLDDVLEEHTVDAARLVCFGTGGWACMLVGYAPKLWKRVTACVIDGGADQEFCGKPIVPYARMQDVSPDAVIVGVNPATQPLIVRRIEQDGFRAIRWDNIIRV